MRWSPILLLVCLTDKLSGINASWLGPRAPEDLTGYVDPFIGTEGQGHPGTANGAGNVFPGAALPFGVVKFGVDTTAFDWTNVDANAGYTPDGYGTPASVFQSLSSGSTLFFTLLTNSKSDWV